MNLRTSPVDLMMAARISWGEPLRSVESFFSRCELALSKLLSPCWSNQILIPVRCLKSRRVVNIVAVTW